MSEQTKAKVLTQIVSYLPEKDGNPKKYTNIMTRLEKDGKSFLVWDNRVTEEQVISAFRAGRARQESLYENPAKEKNGSATVQSAEKAPF